MPFLHSLTPCHYCGRQATLFASGNPAMHVGPHYLCDQCQAKIRTGVINMRQWWRPASPPSPPASSLSPSPYLSSSLPPGPGLKFNPNLVGSLNEVRLKESPYLPVVQQSGPVIGYRVWQVRDDRLVGFLAGDALGSWPAGAVKAKCVQRGHREPPPSADCDCGFYAWRELANVESRHGVAVGAVQMWGKLIEHGNEGWRGEWAKPLCLLRTADVICTTAMSEFYKVAVAEKWDSVELLAGELAQ